MSAAPRPSIRTQLRAWTLALAFSGLVLSLLFLAKNTEDQISQQMLLARDLTQLYADDSVSIEYGRNNLVYVADSLRRLNQLLNGDKARIISNAGVVAESTHTPELGQRPSSPTSAQRVISVEIREHSSQERLGTLQVLINQDALFAKALRKAIVPTLSHLLALSFLSLLMIRSLQKRIIRPIEQILSPSPISPTENANWPEELNDLHSRLQEALARRDLAIIGQIAGGIIHDIKTLLHSVWTAAHLANEQPEGTEKRLKRLESLLKAANTNFPKMNTLIQTTLDGATEIRVQARPGSVIETIEQSIKAVEPLAGRSGVKIGLQKEDRLLTAEHDPAQLERALTNLVKNAVEAASQSGSNQAQVLIRAEGSAEKGIHIAVEDSGPGLGEDPSQVFRSIHSTKMHGSGLGLVISRKIIEAHQGRLLAGASQSLGGAKFDIVLPTKEMQL